MSEEFPIEHIIPTQADRDAAAKVFVQGGRSVAIDRFSSRVRNGMEDGNKWVQAFARHRLSTPTSETVHGETEQLVAELLAMAPRPHDGGEERRNRELYVRAAVAIQWLAAPAPATDDYTRGLEDAARQALAELDGLSKALALLGRLDLTTAINRDIAAPLKATLKGSK